MPSRKTLRIYADACLYISVIKRDEELVDGQPRWQVARSLFTAAQRRDVIIVASTLVQAEVAGNGDVRGTAPGSRTQRIVADWFSSGYIEWCDLDRLVSRHAALLSQQYGLRGADAVHLATAIRMHADYLMSNDRGFTRAYGDSIEGVQVVTPRVMWQETLEDASGGN